MRDQLLKVKGQAVQLVMLNSKLLANGEKQVLNELLALIDCIILDKLDYCGLSKQGYLTGRLLYHKHSLDGWRNTATEELRSSIENLMYEEATDDDVSLGGV
jgi:hypothetical protein